MWAKLLNFKGIFGGACATVPPLSAISPMSLRTWHSLQAQHLRAARGASAPLGRLGPIDERDRGLRGERLEGEALLDVEPHAVLAVVEIAEREILPDAELEVPAARREHDRPLDRGRPNDGTVDEPAHVLDHRVAALRPL